MLPNSPTFGISLAYDARRDRGIATASGTNAPADPAGPAGPGRQNEKRVWLPETAGGGELIAIQPFDGLLGFLARLIDAAKDWQDNLQSTLAGYRDRIVHVYLKPDEGGLNIFMPAELVRLLASTAQKRASSSAIRSISMSIAGAAFWSRWIVLIRRSMTCSRPTEAPRTSPNPSRHSCRATRRRRAAISRRS